MLAIKNLEGEVFLLTGASNIVRKRRVNGEKELSLKLDKTVQNAHFFDDIDKLWRVIDFSGEEYPILIYRDVAIGNGYTREINCLHSFFDDMRNHVIYEKFTGSKTFAAMMEFIFAGSGYTYNIIDQFLANDFENFGDDYGLELFKTALERYVAEFTISGKTVTLRAQIGNTTDFQYRHKFNLESIERDVDALDFSTYGEGFGKGTLHVTYTSPLAAIYGKRSIKAIRDERFTKADSLTATVKEAVDTSLKIALTVKLSDLRASGYNKNHPNEGDTIILVDDRLGLKVDTRIVEIVEALDKKGNVLDCDVTLSNYSNIFEQQRRIHNATKTIADAIDGKRPLPFEALAIAVQQATIALQNAQTELEFPDNGGILAISKTNPNHFVLFNSAGVGISTDAGQTFKTAITAEGIVADVVTAGTLRGIFIEGVEISGSRFISQLNSETYTLLENAFLESRGKFTRTWRGKTSTNDIKMKLENGYLRARNDSLNRSLYFSDFGISTFADGDGDGVASGVIEFFSDEYAGTESLGVTVGSTWGAAGLRSYNNDAIMDGGRHSTIYARTGQVVIRPRDINRVGNNHFVFDIKDNDTASDTDGVIYFGSPTANPPYGVGIRFSKAAPEKTLYITDGTGTKNTGHLSALDIISKGKFIGNIQTPGDNGYFMVAYGSELRVTDTRGYNNGDPSYQAMAASAVRSNSIRVIDGTNLYLGVSGTNDGEVRVTNALLYNEGSPTYYPIKASEYRNGSSITYKTNIEDLEETGLDIINKLQIKKYVLQSDVDNGVYDNWQIGVISELSPEVATKDGLAINVYKMLSYSVKATQELSEKVDTQQQQLTDHELLIGELTTQIDAQKQQLTDFAALTESLTSRLAELEDRIAQLEA